MVEDTHEEHDVEAADALRRQLVHIQLAIIDARAEAGVDFAKQRIIPVIDRYHIGAAAFHFKGEPAVPGADVQYALAAQIGGDGKLRDAEFERAEIERALDGGSIGQLEAMPEAFFGAQITPETHDIEGIGGVLIHGHQFEFTWQDAGVSEPRP